MSDELQFVVSSTMSRSRLIDKLKFVGHPATFLFDKECRGRVVHVNGR